MNLITVALWLQLNYPPRIINATVYAYTAREEETDDSPNITASGLFIGNNITSIGGDELVANNCLCFGAIVYISNQRYRVVDRMNKRYGCEVFDILMPTVKEAREWGKRKVKVEIYD